jgi:hypothetical protein
LSTKFTHNRKDHYVTRNPYREEIREANAVSRSVGWRAAIWILAAILFIAAIGVAVWYFKVATSDAKGAGDQTRIVNDGRNRVNAQEWFQSQYGQIKAADKNLDNAQRELTAATTAEDKSFWRTNFTGLQNRCNDMVQAYNAEANKVSRGQWRDASLPYQIDSADAATDCQPTAAPSPVPTA